MDRKMKHSPSSSPSQSGPKSKIIVSMILAFVLSIVLTLFTSLLAVYLGLFSTNSVITSFNKVDYYHGVLKEFDKKTWDITIPLGLPQEVVKDLVEINQVSRDVKGSLTAGLDQTDYIPDTSQIETKLDDNVRKHFADQGIGLDENQESVLKEYKTTIVKEYLKSVEIPLIKYFGNMKHLYVKVMAIGIPICLILALAAVTLLVRLEKWKHRGVRHIIYSTLAAMLMSGMVPIVILIGGAYKRLSLTPKYFYDFVMEYIKGGLQTFVYCSMVWMIVSIVLLLVCKNMKEKLRHKNKHRSR